MTRSKSDVDGYMSASMLFDFLTKKKYKCSYLLHDENPKAHGLDDTQIMRQLKEKEPSLLIVTDAGSLNNKPCEKLEKLGWEVLILDHHEASAEDNKHAIVVNNKISDRVENKDGSGALVTWHFMHLIDPDLANEYISYVAISIISDSMSFLTNENATFIIRGLQANVIHPNLKPLIDKLQTNYYPLSFSFGGLVVKSNSTIRLGTIEDKKLLFECMCGNHEHIDDVVKIVKHYHTKQNLEATRILEQSVEIDDDTQNVLLCKLSEKTPLTGLVANKLMGKTGKPVLMVHEKADGKVEGSVRSPVPFRDLLNESGLFNYNQGHSFAHGTSYNLENEEIVKEFLYSLTDLEPCYDVLCSLGLNSLSTDLIDVFDGYNELYGNDLKEPQFHIKGLVLNKNDFNVIGKAGTTVKFEKNGWQFIKFFCTHEWIEENIVNMADEVNVEMIGKLQWNEWCGTKSPQFVIERIEFKEFGFDDLF